MPLPRAVGRFNNAVTNRVMSLAAGRLPGFGIISHRGRRSARTYSTPVNVFRQSGGFKVALTYGCGDWVKNVLAAGGAQVRTRGTLHHVTNPRVVDDPTRSGLPAPVRGVLGLLKVDEFLELDDVSGESATSQ